MDLQYIEPAFLRMSRLSSSLRCTEFNAMLRQYAPLGAFSEVYMTFRSDLFVYLYIPIISERYMGPSEFRSTLAPSRLAGTRHGVAIPYILCSARLFTLVPSFHLQVIHGVLCTSCTESTPVRASYSCASDSGGSYPARHNNLYHVHQP
jgi:hypothetical protein